MLFASAQPESLANRPAPVFKAVMRFSPSYLRTRTCLLAVVAAFTTFIVDPAFCQEQILPIKQDFESEKESATTGNGAAKSLDDSDAEVIPLWERQYFLMLDLIEQTILSTEAEYEAAAAESNPLVRSDLERQLKNRLRGQVSGKKFVVFYKLENIRPGKSISRNKQVFKISLESPTFPGAYHPGTLEVVISPTQARQLTIGCIVRVEGELGQETRQSFGLVRLHRATTHQEGDVKTISSIPGPALYSKREHSVFLYVEDVRVVAEKQLEEFNAFSKRLDARADPFHTEPR